MLSLAAGLPLQWSPEIETMFQSMATLSSAGTTLLVPGKFQQINKNTDNSTKNQNFTDNSHPFPFLLFHNYIIDCELTHMRTSDAFFMKQVFFTFIVPIVIVTCILCWMVIRMTCGLGKGCCKKCKIKRYDYKNYTILSIVLMLFLCYPMLSKIALSMLKCVLVGEKRYLMADLEEPCFEGRHLSYVWMLTVPQILFVVIGMPVLGSLIILRNGNAKFLKYNFRMRYGLLYLGYRPSREWWEVVIAVRKVFIVMIGTFGAMLGVDMQAFLSLFVIFIALMIHLVGRPFDTSEAKYMLLHQLECAALTLCWLTFWGGLLFYLGAEHPEILPPSVLILMSIIIVLMNIIFLIFSTYEFFKEFIKDCRKKAETRRRSSVAVLALKNSIKFIGVKVAPVQHAAFSIGTTGSSSTSGGVKVAPVQGTEKSSFSTWNDDDDGPPTGPPTGPAMELVLGPTAKRDMRGWGI
jgi:hypothetical protein